MKRIIFGFAMLTVILSASFGQTKSTIEWVTIPAGTFTMGSPASELNRHDDETQHQVTLSDFKISKYEITNAQYAAFLNTKKIDSDGLYAAGTFPEQVLIYASSWSLTYTNNHWMPVAGYENHPVINVTWYGATEFAAYAGGILPTEEQWEYACRGNTTTPFNTGACLSNTQANYNWSYPYDNCTNTSTTYPGTTQAVGSYPANTYGLYNMHDNVSEWCSSLFDRTAQTNSTDATSSSVRVIRGGGWNSLAQNCRSAIRGDYDSDSYSDFIGFRVVIVP